MIRPLDLARRLFVAALCAIGVAACGDDPAGPGPTTIPDIVGTYSGTSRSRER